MPGRGWHGYRGGGGGGGGGEACYKCGQVGHFARDCRRKAGNKKDGWNRVANSKDTTNNGDGRSRNNKTNKPPSQLSTLQKFFWKIERTESADDVVRVVEDSVLMLLDQIQVMTAPDLEKLVKIFKNMSDNGLRKDKVGRIFTLVGGPFTNRALRAYLPTLYSAQPLQTVLDVILALARTDPATICAHVDTLAGNVVSAMAQCGRCAECALLWEQVQAVAHADEETVQRMFQQRQQVGGRDPEFEDHHIQGIMLTPSVDELLANPFPLPQNRGDGHWDLADDEQIYKQTHFLLQREEMLAPLRESVVSFFRSHNIEHPAIQPGLWSRAQNLHHTMYENAHCVGFGISKSGNPFAKFSFMVKGRVDFGLGSHLMFGSLLMLFQADERGAPIVGSEIYATVEEFDLWEVKNKNQVGLKFVNHADWSKFDISRRYIMLESPAYFQAVKPVLEWLQHPTYLRDCPLSTRLLHGQADADESTRTAPNYLKGVQIDISCLYKRELAKKPAWQARDPLTPWPNADDIELDASQALAMQHILKAAVALAQGPPGTGKSYIGVKAVEMLHQALHAKYGSRDAGPIVLVCLTNHALDQFLEDLLEIEHFKGRGKLIRFGGQSKSESPELLECAIHKFMDCSSDERQDRRKTREKVEMLMSHAQRLQATLCVPEQRLESFAGLLSAEAVYENLFATLDDELVERALFLSTDPALFIRAVVAKWTSGASRCSAENDLLRDYPILNDANQPQSRKGQVQNRFAAFDHEGSGPFGRTLSKTDMQVAMAEDEQNQGCAVHFTAAANRMVEEEDSEEEFVDDHDVDNILLERQDVLGAQWTQETNGWATNDGDGRVAAAVGRTQLDKKRRLRNKLISLCEQKLVAERDAESYYNDGDSENGNWHEQEAQRYEKKYNEKSTKWKPLRKKVQKETIMGILDGFFLRIEKRMGSLSNVVANDGDEIGALQRLRQRPSAFISWEQREKKGRQTQFDHVIQCASTICGPSFQAAMEAAEGECRTLAQIKKVAQLRACKDAAVVGMTSTFAALNRDLLQRLGFRVVMVEEAGELLECQLMACLSSNVLEHVILIGDHQQLRPKVNCYDLCVKKQFDISLFERLVRARGNRVTALTRQLRMHPDISALISPFYEKMEDHSRVLDRAMVPGVADRLFWLSHSVLEDGTGKHQSITKSNKHEAHFAVRLALHFVYQGVAPEKITILTPYQGQKRQTRQLLADMDSRSDNKTGGRLLPKWVDDPNAPAANEGNGKGGKGGRGQGKGGKSGGKGKGTGNNVGRKFIPGIRCVTIDDYQGEENDIIIVSLVRSNPENKLGFCKIENRIIVGLSRARCGMFILGNAEMFRTDPNWLRIQNQLQANGRVGDKLNLSCAKHPREDLLVAKTEDFDRVAKHGGCARKCDSLLAKCGHCCPLRCHPFDPEHMQTACVERCTRPRVDGCDHCCKQMCKNCPGDKPDDLCPTPCPEPVKVRLPCGHDQIEDCCTTTLKFDSIMCKMQVWVTLACGHMHQAACWQSQLPDEVAALKCLHVETVIAPCGHEVKKECGTVQECKKICSKTAGCGHKCVQKCTSATHDHTKSCGRKCKELLFCGHGCQSRCGEPCTVLCEEICTRTCTHGHKCPNKCFEDCVACHEPCAWRCAHKCCEKLCHKLCGREPCNERCDKVLDCGCVCHGVCGEPCPACPHCDPLLKEESCPLSLTKFKDMDPGDKIYRLPCGHTFDMEMLDMHFASQPENGGHQSIQAKNCPSCRAPIYAAPRYGDTIKKQLVLIDAVKAELKNKHSRLSEEDRRMINSAMGETRGLWTGSHWFACPNGHPYFIGECGGAVVQSACPECGASIGGTNHSLRTDNTHIMDFAGLGPQQHPYEAMMQRPLEDQLANMHLD